MGNPKGIIMKDCLKLKCSWCCERMVFPIYSKDHENWAKLHRVPIIIKWGRKLIDLPISCSKLKNHKCTIYNKRPMMCIQFDCDMFKEGIMKFK